MIDRKFKPEEMKLIDPVWNSFKEAQKHGLYNSRVKKSKVKHIKPISTGKPNQTHLQGSRKQIDASKCLSLVPNFNVSLNINYHN